MIAASVSIFGFLTSILLFFKENSNRALVEELANLLEIEKVRNENVLNASLNKNDELALVVAKMVLFVDKHKDLINNSDSKIKDINLEMSEHKKKFAGYLDFFTPAISSLSERVGLLEKSMIKKDGLPKIGGK
jgi:hypothetical protein